MPNAGVPLLSGGVKDEGALYRLLRAIPPLRAAVRFGRAYLARHRLPVWRLEGLERASGTPLEIVFAGKLENKNYIAELAYGGTESETSLGRKWVRDLVHRAATCGKGKEAMVFVELDESQRHRFGGRFPFHVPCWVGGDIDLTAAMARLQHSRNAKEDMRRFRKNQIDYQVSTDREMFERFYRDMYLPYIKNVYGNRAFLMSHEEMESRLDHCELFLVKSAVEFVAGQILFFPGAGRVQGWSIGVKDGDRAYVKAGALKALGHFIAAYLSERGYATLHMGASRPFLRDGVLHHKRRRGLRITDHAEREFAFNYSVESAGAWGFLMNNPFIHEREGEYRGAVFSDGHTPLSEEQLQALYNELFVNGMAEMDVYLAKPVPTTVSIPPELRGKLRLRHGFNSSVHEA